MAKILVTGGAGFIGSHIVDRLLEGKHAVEVIDNLSSGSEKNLQSSVTLHRVDIRSEEARAVVETFAPDVIVHAAAQVSVRISMDEPTLDSDLNVTGLINIVSPLRGRKGVHVVFLSSGGAVYGEQESFPAAEHHAIAPESLYGLSKRVGEMYLEFWQRVWGVSSSWMRLANVYGPRQNPHGEAGVVAIFCERLLAGKSIAVNGTGEQTRDFIFVRDVAEAICLAAEKRPCGPFNIGTAEETSINTLAKGLRDMACPTAEISHASAKAGEQLRSCIDNSKAQRELGWKPSVSFIEGLSRTLEWYRSGSVR